MTFPSKPSQIPPAASAPERILLIRLSAFGDVVIATTLLHALKKSHPQAEVDWLVQPELADFLRTQAAISNVIVWDRKAWGLLFRKLHWWALGQAVVGFAKRLRQRRYDWVIDAQGLAKSRLLAGLAGGRLRIGYASKEPLEWLLDQTVQRFPEAHPSRMLIGSEHGPMAEALNLSPLGPPKLVAPTQAPSSRGAPIVLTPFTTRPQKHWPEQHWRQLIRQLVDRRLPLQLLGGPADTAAANRLLEGFNPAEVDNQVGRTRYIDTLQLIAQARAVVGVDTGLTHLGVALGRPTVAIFGSTLPYAAAPGELATRLIVISLRLACGPCGRKPSCAGRWDCLNNIAPTQVEAALMGLLTEIG